MDVVHYPRQGRCVLRYRLSLGAGGSGELRHPVVFGKVYSDGGAAAAASALRVLAPGPRRPCPDGVRVDVPAAARRRPLTAAGPGGGDPGRPLLPDLVKAACDADGSSPAPDPRGTVRGPQDRGPAAAAIHACAPRGLRCPSGISPASGQRPSGTSRCCEPVWPEAAARLRRVRGTGARARRAPAVRPRRPDGRSRRSSPTATSPRAGAARRLGAGAGIVDVDTLCVAEPALDLGRFLAYLHVTGIRRSRAAWPVLADLTALFLESYLDAAAPLPGTAPAAGARRSFLERTAAYRALALARIGASACRQLKDDRLAAVVDVLDAGNAWRRSVAG